MGQGLVDWGYKGLQGQGGTWVFEQQHGGAREAPRARQVGLLGPLGTI